MQDTYLSFLSMCTRAYMILHTQHTTCLAMSNRVNHSTRRGGFSTLVTQSIATGSVTGCGLVFFRFETKSSYTTVDKVDHSRTICLKFQHHHHSLGHFLSCPNTHTHTHTHTHTQSKRWHVLQDLGRISAKLTPMTVAKSQKNKMKRHV